MRQRPTATVQAAHAAGGTIALETAAQAHVLALALFDPQHDDAAAESVAETAAGAGETPGALAYIVDARSSRRVPSRAPCRRVLPPRWQRVRVARAQRCDRPLRRRPIRPRPLVLEQALAALHLLSVPSARSRRPSRMPLPSPPSRASYCGALLEASGAQSCCRPSGLLALPVRNTGYDPTVPPTPCRRYTPTGHEDKGRYQAAACARAPRARIELGGSCAGVAQKRPHDEYRSLTAELYERLVLVMQAFAGPRSKSELLAPAELGQK
mmetsp:Transcript_33507/g.107710  ORF Transcript_33507/g.107710 Transcript_33507/m.107710 type:complete len:268 (-) Transcript_33507:27-830(-)